MGSWHDAATCAGDDRRLARRVRAGSRRAYADTAPHGAIPAARHDPLTPRVIRFRTFSKAYGLAGLRGGPYALGPPRVRHRLQQDPKPLRPWPGWRRRGRFAALADQGLPRRDHGAPFAAARGPPSPPIAREQRADAPCPRPPIFVTVDCGRDGTFARAVLASLVGQGLFRCACPFTPPQDRCIPRVSAGTEADLDLFAVALPRALAEAAGVTAS